MSQVNKEFIQEEQLSSCTQSGPQNPINSLQ